MSHENILIALMKDWIYPDEEHSAQNTILLLGREWPSETAQSWAFTPLFK